MYVIIKDIERSCDLREPSVQRRSVVNTLATSFDVGIPIDTVKFRIVVMLLDVIGNCVEHL